MSYNYATYLTVLLKTPTSTWKCQTLQKLSHRKHRGFKQKPLRGTSLEEYSRQKVLTPPHHTVSIKKTMARTKIRLKGQMWEWYYHPKGDKRVIKVVRRHPLFE